MSDQAMSGEQLHAYAEELLKEHAKEVEYLSIFECAEDSPHVPGDEIDDEDAQQVSDLISKATVTVTWETSRG